MSAAAPSTTTSRQVKRVALASAIGTTLEYYDFYLYGALSAIVFGRLFFPATEDPAIGTLLAFATFGVGFVARPVGGIITGHFGDRVGRKSMLILTLSVMGVSTVGIGLLPTYETAGVLAPILLVTLRLIQGLAHGGEWGGAVIMAVEHAPEGKRAFYGTWPQMGVYCGIVLSNLVLSAFLLLPDEQFDSWGWRLPFLLGSVLVFVGLFLRSGIHETPEFTEVKDRAVQHKLPIVTAVKTNLRGILVTFGAKAAETGAFYLITVFGISYAANNTGIARGTALNGVLVAAFIALLTVGFFGVLADRIGRRPVYVAGAVFTGLFAFPFFWLADTGNTVALWAALIAGLAIGHAAMYGAQSAYFSELFEADVRYSGASLGYQLGAALIGGFTPLIAAALLLASNDRPWPVALYIIGLCLITVVAVGVFGQVRTKRTVAPTTRPVAPTPNQLAGS